MSEPVLSYHSEGISASLKHSSRALVGAMDFVVHRGEKLALIGETGSGKTLTALSIMGLLPSNVSIKGLGLRLVNGQGKGVSGIDVFGEVGSSIVYIPQNGLESLNPTRTVRAQVYDMLRKNGTSKGELPEKALEVLGASGFEDPKSVADLYPFQLSGGMAQRVTIALAMTGHESLVIADEPTNGLDRQARGNFIDLLDSRFPQAGKLIITHDMALAEITDNVIVIKGGLVMEQGTSGEVLGDPRCQYTKALIEALVKNGMKQTPRLRADGSCCPFYSRCPKAAPECFSVSLHSQGTHNWRCL